MLKQREKFKTCSFGQDGTPGIRVTLSYKINNLSVFSSVIWKNWIILGEA